MDMVRVQARVRLSSRATPGDAGSASRSAPDADAPLTPDNGAPMTPGGVAPAVQATMFRRSQAMMLR